MVKHHTSSPHHPHANKTIEAFNKIMEHCLTKVCAVNRDDWDEIILAVLWVYRTTMNKLTKHMPFNLVYG